MGLHRLSRVWRPGEREEVLRHRQQRARLPDVRRRPLLEQRSRLQELDHERAVPRALGIYVRRDEGPAVP